MAKVMTHRAGELGQSTRSTVHVLFPLGGRCAMEERRRRDRLRATFYDLGDREPNEIRLHRSYIETDTERLGEWARLQWLYGP